MNTDSSSSSSDKYESEEGTFEQCVQTFLSL